MDDAPTVHVVRGEEDAQDNSASDRAGKAKTGRQETPKSGNNKLGGVKEREKGKRKIIGISMNTRKHRFRMRSRAEDGF